MAKQLVVITGDKRVNRMLRRLAGNDAKAVIRKASRKTLKQVLPGYKAAVPVSDSVGQGRDKQGRFTAGAGVPGKLRRAMKVRAARRSRTGVGARITIDGSKFPGLFYGGFQEWGWRPRGGIRKIPGRFFLKGETDRKRHVILAWYRYNVGREILHLARRP